MIALSSTKLCLCSASAALIIAALGCGDETDFGAGGASGSGGSTGSGASGGSGGSGGTGGSTTGGSGGSGATGGTGGIPDAGEIMCGTTVCPPSTFGIPACCTSENTCGFTGFNGMCSGGFDAGAPRIDAGAGVPDPNCATVMIGSGLMLNGCCRSDNTCGFSNQFIPGCLSYEQLRAVPGIGSSLPDSGPMSCVYPPP
jgi:hypothetical protein